MLKNYDTSKRIKQKKEELVTVIVNCFVLSLDPKFSMFQGSTVVRFQLHHLLHHEHHISQIIFNGVTNQ